MIRPEEFYQQTNQNFRDVFAKIDEYHKDNCQKIDRVVEQVADLRTTVMAHIASSDTAIQIKGEHNATAREQKNHKVYWILGIVSTIQAAVTAILVGNY